MADQIVEIALVLDQHRDAVDGELRHVIGPERDNNLVGGLQCRQRRERKARRAIEDDDIVVALEAADQAFHTAADAVCDDFGIVALVRLLQIKLALNIFEKQRSRHQGNGRRLAVGRRDVADVLCDVIAGVRRDAVEKIVKIVGDRLSGLAGLVPSVTAHQD